MKKYIWLLSIGLTLSFSLCFSIISGCPYWVTVLMDILTMLGSGLVCSAVVTWIVESNNEKHRKLDLKRQRIFALSAIVNRTKYLLKNEIRNMSAFLLVREEKKRKVRKATASIEEVANILQGLLQRINPIIKTEYKPSPLKERLLFADLIPVYQTLNRNILGVLEDSPVYFVNGIFDEEGIHRLQEFQAQLNEIISWSHPNSVEEVIETKLTFVSETLSYFTALQIDVKQEMEYFVNEEIGAIDVTAE